MRQSGTSSSPVVRRLQAKRGRIGLCEIQTQRFEKQIATTTFVRSRLVTMQRTWDTRTDCFAVTPALCCVRLVLSFAATLCAGRRSRLCDLHDVSVAFHAVLDEDTWVDPRKEQEDEHGVAWQLKKALYRTRRSALLFQECVIHAMVKIRFTVVRAAAQRFYQAAWLVLAIVHGDDFIAADAW